MALSERPFEGEADFSRMCGLVHRYPRSHLHVIDLPYRLSSWAFRDPQNARLWFDEGGILRAWAVMQPPFWTIDYAFDPITDRALHGQVLDWAVERARQMLEDPRLAEHPEDRRECWFVNVFAGQKERMEDLTARGFADQVDAPEDAWSMVFLTRPATASAQKKSLPPGYRLRALNGPAEVAAYVALHREVFGTKNMTEEWRAQTLRQPAYRPELDLVIEAPDASLAAFCIGWYDPAGYGGRPCGQIEPLGVSEAHRHPGMAKLLLNECFRRLQALGAEQIYVQTDNFRDGALGLYLSTSFYLLQDIHVFRKNF
jgi:ribosomal protein S18 acetylase RimI-like enzyme